MTLTRDAVRSPARSCAASASDAAYGPADFASQQQVVGGCYALRLSVGEYFEHRGRLGARPEEYEAILADDPRSLWARMRLGHLALKRGRAAEAAVHYGAATDLAPRLRPRTSDALGGQAAGGQSEPQRHAHRRTGRRRNRPSGLLTLSLAFPRPGS